MNISYHYKPYMPFMNFVNAKHPTYEGIDEQNVPVKVILIEWLTDSQFGTGKIYPYTIPSMYNNSDRHQGVFEVDLCEKNIIYFTEDNYSEGTVLRLKFSDDFKTLTILNLDNDKIERGILKLQEEDEKNLGK